MRQEIINRYDKTYEALTELKTSIKNDDKAGVTSIVKLQSLVKLQIQFEVFADLYDIIVQEKLQEMRGN